VLEEVRVDLAALDCLVRGHVVGELDDLKGDPLFREVVDQQAEYRGVGLRRRADGENRGVLLLAGPEEGRGRARAAATVISLLSMFCSFYT
jgi:hypothetical protein